MSLYVMNYQIFTNLSQCNKNEVKKHRVAIPHFSHIGIPVLSNTVIFTFVLVSNSLTQLGDECNRC